MQVKLFTRAGMSQSAFEQEVNDFMVTVNVIGLKINQSMADGEYCRPLPFCTNLNQKWAKDGLCTVVRNISQIIGSTRPQARKSITGGKRPKQNF